MDSIAVDIAGFAYNALNREPVILLKRKGELEPIKSLVPIAVGPVEAQAIVSALQGFEPPRPMTHDLMNNILSTLHADVRRVDVHSFHEGTFLAAITLVQNGVTFIVDARPSDALALAVRCGAPIYLDQDVFNASSIETKSMTQPNPADDAQHPSIQEIYNQIHNFAENVQPSDFKI
ncbi:MAG: bifunctional nuclease family protein [Coriobacteriia bacterium]|nr:bifunctional nuclease family protein [Coriobacteriia bacterium]MCL2745609.1 bifunctional nuclease family protein [Coriobacteriia bacterium]MCL2871312.1 bifunctional nuclease family protein [Coriobacteriia bacterium]